jgi:hypothetical protein
MLRLIDYEKEQPVEIDGTVFQIKPLSQGQWLKTLSLMRDIDTKKGIDSYGEVTQPELITILEAQIVSIDLPEYAHWSREKILKSMMLENFLELVRKVVEISTISETESKN